MSLILGSVQLGLIYGILALGIYIAFRILNVPDLTCEGSFTAGLAVSAVVVKAGHPFVALILAIFAGIVAGSITGFLQTKCKIHPILAGILVMSGLYPINLFILGGSPNVAIINDETVFKIVDSLFKSQEISKLAVALIGAVLAVIILSLFFKTHTGLAIRATGDNEAMVRASSIDADKMKILSLAIGNGTIALSGAMIAQYQNYADISSGSGMLVLGLASVIIGELVLFKKNLTFGFVCVVIGSIVYRLIIALAMKLPFFDASYLKLISSVIVAIALSIPAIKEYTAIKATGKRGVKNA